jgi:hypothetical protein
VAHACVMRNDANGPVAESFLRESGASFFILVQIQAGPPTFAANAASARQASAL